MTPLKKDENTLSNHFSKVGIAKKFFLEIFHSKKVTLQEFNCTYAAKIKVYLHKERHRKYMWKIVSPK